jgi:acetolactate synthase-1/2/3 large subunit
VLEASPVALNFPADHPCHAGYSFGSHSHPVLGEADAIVVVDSDVPWYPSRARPREEARVVQLAVDPFFGRYPMRSFPCDVPIAGEPAVALPLLADAVRRRVAAEDVAARRERLAARHRAARAAARAAAEAERTRTPIGFQWAARCVADVVTPETIVVGDGGDIVGCASKVVPIDRPGQWLDPGPLGCLGVGPSFALAAKLLHPGRRVLLIAGDGALGLNGMELETAVRFGLPLTCVVGNDGGWGQIRNPQLSFYGEARAVATSLPHTRFDLVTEALGGRGVLVREPSRIGPALARALASDEVWCVNVILDPEAYKKTGTVSMAI